MLKILKRKKPMSDNFIKNNRCLLPEKTEKQLCRCFFTRYFCILLFLLALSFFANFANAADNIKEGVVTAESLNVRMKPAAQKVDPVLAILKKNEKVSIIREQDGWFEIKVPPTAEVWILGKFIENNTVIKEARLRSGPGLQFPPYPMNAKPGMKIEFIRKNPDGWVKIKPPENLSAWVAAKFVNTVSSTKEIANQSQTPVSDTKNQAAPNPNISPISEEKKQSESPVPAQEEKKENKPATTAGVKPPDTPVKNQKGVKPSSQEAIPVPTYSDAEKKSSDTKTTDVKSNQKKVSSPENKDNGSWVGYLATVSASAMQNVTHALINDKQEPLCYLSGKSVNLGKFSGQRVKVRGKEIKFSDWKYPIIEVENIEPAN